MPERFYGLHVFNPVTRMELIELCLPELLGDGVGDRARAFCAALGKRAIEVPDHPGFVVNRLLFPYLFDAVRLLDDLGLEAREVDDCMTLGAGQPMGPLKLLDFVGIDVAVAIGESLHEASEVEYHQPPQRLIEMAGDGKARPQVAARASTRTECPGEVEASDQEESGDAASGHEPAMTLS